MKMKFLKNRKGETLVETLVAILVFSLASIVLYSMVTTAARLNAEAKEKDRLVQEQLAIAEIAALPADPSAQPTGTITVTLSPSGTQVAKFQVYVFGGATDPSGSRALYSYFKKP